MRIKLLCAISCITIMVGKGQPNVKPDDPKVTIRTIFHMDSLFWEAYNACDVDKMATFFTDDMEFYHDKGGLTTPKFAFVESVRKGMCGNSDWHLRREPIAGTVKVFPMKDIGGLISGEHVFYINETGKKEYLDGYGKFTQLWVFKNNEWKMSRVLSYDHAPAPYVNKRIEINVKTGQLMQHAGQYQSPTAGLVTITPGDNSLSFQAGDFKTTLFPESAYLFFVKDRDLQFEFVTEGTKTVAMIVHEKGKKVEEAKRVK